MPRQAGSFVDNNFSRGLITEATGLNFPENACTETFDCVFDPDGTVTRRLGWEYEDGYVMSSVTRDDSHVATFMWESVAGTGDISFCVVQIGTVLHFWQVDETGALSADKQSFTVDLTTYQTSGSPDVASQGCDFSSGNGYLFVTHPYCESLFIEYDSSADDITVNEITLYIRDFDGLDEGNDYETRPTTLTTTHKYNLHNQGWYVDAETANDDTFNVLETWDYYRSDFPSNADVWWTYKDTNSKFNVNYVDRYYRGNSPAPKGHFILEALNKDRSDVSGLGSIPVVSSSYFRPTTNAFANGRVWYGGVNYTGYNNRVYFSQIINDTDNFGYCYQLNDPTSEDINDLLDTDGGVIVIPEMAQLIKIVPLGTLILIFATNGVWSLTGRQGIGFAPTDYSVAKVSSVPALTNSSFVYSLDGLPMWWNSDGIYTIQIKESGSISVVSVTDQTIQEFYDDIPVSSKENAVGAYNSLSKTVQWCYRSSTTADLDELQEFNRVLTLDVRSGAFYPWTISQPTDGPRIIGIVASQGSGSTTEDENVVNSSGVNVTNAALTQVTASVTTTVQFPSSYRFLTVVPDSGTTYNATFSQARDATYFDWTIFTAAEEYESYFLTGYRIHGEAQRRFQIQDIFWYFENQTNASCYFQPIWDYASDDTGGRWGNEQQVIASRSYYGVQRTKRPVRGSGYSLQFRVRSEGGKPFKLIGWSAFETSNAGT